MVGGSVLDGGLGEGEERNLEASGVLAEARGLVSGRRGGEAMGEVGKGSEGMAPVVGEARRSSLSAVSVGAILWEVGSGCGGPRTEGEGLRHDEDKDWLTGIDPSAARSAVGMFPPPSYENSCWSISMARHRVHEGSQKRCHACPSLKQTATWRVDRL